MIIKIINKYRDYWSSVKKINLKNKTELIKSCDVLFFCHDVDRSVSLNGQAYSPLIDSLKDDFERKGLACVTIAHPWSKIVGQDAYGQPIAINRSYLFARLLEFCSKSLSFNPVLELYRKLILRANPQVIITIGCNDALCEAARSVGVFHVELLHGVGYTSMPWGWDNKEKKNLPQGILSLDDISTQTFLELEQCGVIVKEISHPFLRRFVDVNDDTIPAEWLSTSENKRFKKEILVSLQWGYASGVDEHDAFKGFLNNGIFYDELEDAIKLTSNTIFWRFRLHPVQYRQPKKYKKLLQFIEEFVTKYENCDWQESTYMPLPSLLRQCSGHITMSSMTSYEAAYLGVPTLALCPSLRTAGDYRNVFEDLVEKNYLIKQQHDLHGILRWTSEVRKKEPLLSNLSSYRTDNLIEWLGLK